MSRYLLCPSCGEKFKPHPEDIKDGLQFRKVNLIAKRPANMQVTISDLSGRVVERIPVPEMVCDFCNTSIPDGSKATALTIYRKSDRTDVFSGTPEKWESEYGEVIP